MAIDQFLQQYQNTLLNKKIINPLTKTPSPVAKTVQFGISPGKVDNTQSSGFGSQVPDWLQGKTDTSLKNYLTDKSERTTAIAQKYSNMAAGQIPVNEYGIPTDKLTDFSNAFNSQLSATGDIGKSALASEEAKARWQGLQSQAELNAGYQVNWTPGASSGNPGAKAVAIAMQAVNNHTPYVWGGNSLTKGVDCSGLVQQVYKQLGINVPRTTYEQAKSGKIVSLNNLLPGDLIFYNTGSSDPNGIGTLSHVAIYIGNGQIIEAPRRGIPVRISSINGGGTPARAVRPW